MGMIMMLAFLIDQAQEICCQYYQCLRKAGTYKSLWGKLRVTLTLFVIESWEHFYEIMIVSVSPATKRPTTG